MLEVHGAFFAVADDIDLILGNASQHHRAFYRFGAALAQGDGKTARSLLASVSLKLALKSGTKLPSAVASDLIHALSEILATIPNVRCGLGGEAALLLTVLLAARRRR